MKYVINGLLFDTNRSQLRGFGNLSWMPLYPLAPFSSPNSYISISTELLLKLTFCWSEKHISQNPDVNHKAITTPVLSNTNQMHILLLYFTAKCIPPHLQLRIPLEYPPIPNWS